MLRDGREEQGEDKECGERKSREHAVDVAGSGHAVVVVAGGKQERKQQQRRIAAAGERWVAGERGRGDVIESDRVDGETGQVGARLPLQLGDS